MFFTFLFKKSVTLFHRISRLVFSVQVFTSYILTLNYYPVSAQYCYREDPQVFHIKLTVRYRSFEFHLSPLSSCRYHNKFSYRISVCLKEKGRYFLCGYTEFHTSMQAKYNTFKQLPLQCYEETRTNNVEF
jgi:hypothetical protein